MRGMGDFQRAQMKHRDARVSAMAQHLRAAVDLWEEIQLYPFKREEPAEAPPQAPPPAPPPVIALPPEKLAYGIKEAASALGVSKTTIWRAMKEGKLSAVKVGNRTLIKTEALQAWLSAPVARKK
ncbi:MAG: helix-turn-helix domain-containing protein [Hyphomonadaceae bacterium]